MGGVFLEGQDGVPLESEKRVPVLVVLLTGHVTSDNPPTASKFLFLHLSMVQCLVDYVALVIK